MNRHYRIRPTTCDDKEAVMSMYDHSRNLMRSMGNTTQWVGYPTASQLAADIANGSSWIVELRGRAVGTFALVDGDEPTYGRIDHGRWTDTAHRYATIHRVARAAGVHGIAAAAFCHAKKLHPYLRVDTHVSNPAMRHIIECQGFVPSGTVYMNDGSERLAYEWWRWDEVDAGLKAFAERYVLPRFAKFDAAHRADHARRVVARTMLLGSNYGLNPDMLYAAAVMHDVGLAQGREHHHLASGAAVRKSQALHRWFDADCIETIAQACEDHRAGRRSAPRSLLGRVVAEADRDVEPERIVRRTVEYGLDHYPTLDREGHWQRTLQHLHEKYAEGGYISLWLPDSPNAAPLSELRSLIADENSLRKLFDRLYDILTGQ